MKKNKFKHLFFALCAVAASALIFTACDPKDDPDEPEIKPEALAAPTNVTASQSGTTVVVQWNKVTDATSYKIFRSNTETGTYTQLDTVDEPDDTGLIMSYTDNNPLNGNNYYKVKAANDAGDSDFSAAAFCNFSTGGDDGEGLTVTAQVEGGNKYNNIFKRVQAASWNGTDGDYATIAIGPYANGGFTLTLPETLHAKFLMSVRDIAEEDFITVSNLQANVSDMPDFEAYSSTTGNLHWSNDDWMGDFIYGKISLSEVSESFIFAGYVYADRDVNITGTLSETDWWYDDEYGDIESNFTLEYNIFLKKGWNLMYQTHSIDLDFGENSVTVDEKVIFSTTAVSGLKWYFDEDFYDLFDKSDFAKKARMHNAQKKPNLFGNKFDRINKK